MVIKRKIVEEAVSDRSVKILRSYLGYDLRMREARAVQTESDFNASIQQRFSDDNGETWTEFKDDNTYYEEDDEKEIIKSISAIVPNTVTGHMVRTVMDRVFLYEHKKVYKHYWTTGKMDWRDHTYIEISKDNGKTYYERYLLAYEDGEGLHQNHGYHGTNIEITKDGRILTSICAPVKAVAKAYGLNPDDYALDTVITKAVVVFIFKYSEDTKSYEINKSNPIIISDDKSSRGLLEPNIIQLTNGSYILECRGSNVVTDGWNTRMKKGSPGHRWVSFSDDGINFSQIEPMVYDDGTAFFSPSSISKWLRHSVNEKLYWLGNILPENPEGNMPRQPLCIGEFDEINKCLLKDTIMVVDYKGEGEGERLQCSNFSFYEDRITHEMKIEYSRLGQSHNHRWMGDAVRFTITI